MKKIHFVGIKGVGMAPLAIIAKEAGLEVTGSDIADDFITDEPLKRAGIIPFVGFSKDHLGNADLVITTGAHGGFDNEEVKAAREKNIPVVTQGEAVGKFMAGEIINKQGLQGISIAGAHGKTTTTALVATIFKECGLDPSFVIGTGDVPSLGGPGHFGKGKYFVAEADEYATEPVYDKTAKFLWQKPKIAVITNIEFDHPDLYPTLDSMREAFVTFARNVEKDGVLIANGDDHQIQKLLQSYSGRVITFGFGQNNDFQLTKVHVGQDQTFFWVGTHQTDLGEFALQISGEHNALNGLAALIVGLEAGLDIVKIRKGLLKFYGTKRRLEYIGTLRSGAMLLDDYAHHPTEIRSTLSALRKSHPKAHITCVFQPHTYSRTKALFDEFLHAFSDADTVILAPIYPSLREAKDETVSSEKLAQAMRSFHKHVEFSSGMQNVVEYIDQLGSAKGDIVITMGAGDVYKISPKLQL